MESEKICAGTESVGVPKTLSRETTQTKPSDCNSVADCSLVGNVVLQSEAQRVRASRKCAATASRPLTSTGDVRPKAYVVLTTAPIASVNSSLTYLVKNANGKLVPMPPMADGSPPHGARYAIRKKTTTRTSPKTQALTGTGRRRPDRVRGGRRQVLDPKIIAKSHWRYDARRQSPKGSNISFSPLRAEESDELLHWDSAVVCATSARQSALATGSRRDTRPMAVAVTHSGELVADKQGKSKSDGKYYGRNESIVKLTEGSKKQTEGDCLRRRVGCEKQTDGASESGVEAAATISPLEIAEEYYRRHHHCGPSQHCKAPVRHLEARRRRPPCHGPFFQESRGRRPSALRFASFPALGTDYYNGYEYEAANERKLSEARLRYAGFHTENIEGTVDAAAACQRLSAAETTTESGWGFCPRKSEARPLSKSPASAFGQPHRNDVDVYEFFGVRQPVADTSSRVRKCVSVASSKLAFKMEDFS